MTAISPMSKIKARWIVSDLGRRSYKAVGLRVLERGPAVAVLSGPRDYTDTIVAAAEAAGWVER